MSTTNEGPRSALALCTAGAADAQGLHLSFGKHTRHGDFGISFSVPTGYAAERRPEPRRVWVPGRYETVERRVWVEGGERREWVPARYETRYDECGRPYSVLVRQGFWKTECEPGHFEPRPVTVWVDGYWRVEPAVYVSPRFDAYGCGRS
jgi:hypothetical protein